MNDNRTCEYTVAQKIEGKWKTKRVLMILLYLAFSLGYFFTCTTLKLLPVACFTPLFTWILVFFTWRYVSVSYQYEIVSGDMIFRRVMSERFKKPMFTLKIKDFDYIAPYTDRMEQSRLEAFAPEKTLWAASSINSPDLYFAYFTDEKGKRTVLYFEATHHALQLLKLYNKNTVLSKVRY